MEGVATETEREEEQNWKEWEEKGNNQLSQLWYHLE